MKIQGSRAAAGSILVLALMAPAASGQSEGLKRAAEAIPLLTSALADAAPPVRANAAAALWKLAPAPRPAWPASSVGS
jgi:hypothetical protein